VECGNGRRTISRRSRTHVGVRVKNAPAFDHVDASSWENNEFGRSTVAAQHFTLYSLRRKV
jgi:hypothetical protein